MRIVSASRLREYYQRFHLTRNSLAIWEARTKDGSWQSTQEVMEAFGSTSAKVLNGERVRFKINGNRHRLIVAYYFPSQTAYIKFIGTHAEYDEVDALTVG